jgi:FtsH-binding integral membrane protein
VSYFPSERTQVRGRLSSGLLGKVFGLLAFSLAFAVVGGWVGAQLGPGWILPLVLVEIGLIIGVHVARNKEGLNLALLYGFTFVSGMTLGPIIAAYTGAGLGILVLEAVLITGVMTAGLGAYALTTKRDLSGLGPYLFMGVLGLVVASIIGIFVGGGLFSALLGFAGAVVFSLLLVYDVQRAKYAEDTMGNAVVLTLGIYLDIINLFLSILRILSYLQGGSRD